MVVSQICWWTPPPLPVKVESGSLPEVRRSARTPFNCRPVFALCVCSSGSERSAVCRTRPSIGGRGETKVLLFPMISDFSRIVLRCKIDCELSFHIEIDNCSRKRPDALIHGRNIGGRNLDSLSARVFHIRNKSSNASVLSLPSKSLFVQN